MCVAVSGLLCIHLSWEAEKNGNTHAKCPACPFTTCNSTGNDISTPSPANEAPSLLQSPHCINNTLKPLVPHAHPSDPAISIAGDTQPPAALIAIPPRGQGSFGVHCPFELQQRLSLTRGENTLGRRAGWAGRHWGQDCMNQDGLGGKTNPSSHGGRRGEGHGGEGRRWRHEPAATVADG